MFLFLGNFQYSYLVEHLREDSTGNQMRSGTFQNYQELFRKCDMTFEINVSTVSPGDKACRGILGTQSNIYDGTFFVKILKGF